MYRNNSNGNLVLTDIDGNAVNDPGLFGLESVEPTAEDCISMSYNVGGLKFVPANCSSSRNIVCLTEWPGMYMSFFIDNNYACTVSLCSNASMDVTRNSV